MRLSRKNRVSCLLLASALAGGVILSQGLTAGRANAWLFGKSLSGLEKRVLEAESVQDKEKSIALWKEILSGLEKGRDSGNPAISAPYARASVVGAYMALHAKERDFDHLEKAREFIRSAYADPEERAWSLADMAGQLSVDGSFRSDGALKRFVFGLIDDAAVEAGELSDVERKGRIYYGLVTLLTRMEEDKPLFGADSLAQAHEMIAGIQDAVSRARAMRALALAGRNVPGAWPPAYAPLYEVLARKKVTADNLLAVHKQALAADHFDLALASLLVIEKEKERTAALFPFFEKMFTQGDISRARRVAEKIDNPAKAVDAWSELGGRYLVNGYVLESREAYEKADAAAARIKKLESREKAETLIRDRKERDAKRAEKKSEKPGLEDRKRAGSALKKLDKDGDITSAVAMARTIEDMLLRVQTFRRIAEIQTAHNDKYGVLKENGRKSSEPYRLEETKGGAVAAADQKAIDAYESGIGKQMNDKPRGLIIQEGLESAIGEIIPEEPLIDRLAANGDTIRAMTPLPGAAEIERSYYENNLFSAKFYEVYGNAGFVGRQGVTAPEVVVIENGRVDLPMLADILKDRGFEDYLTREGKIFTLRRPVVIGPKASLVVTGDDVAEWRLSTRSGAFIANAGKLYISDTRLVAWNDEKNAPMWAYYGDKRSFRPFLTNWSQSEIYMGSSDIVALGYANGKSYGLSLSAGPSAWFKFGNDNQSLRPTGIIVDNSFRNMLYGFYSYEADDVVLSGNEYIDNVVYGVDPHDRSRRLAIGYNTAYGTHKKHGIIISREVDDSIIFGNVTFDNKGTGIMLDRDSNGTLVYGNTTFHNAQEGMTLFESDCEIIAANRVFENKGSGFRIRNSYNIGLFYNDITHNKSAGISAYSATLKGDPVHQHRDFALDPYDELTAITAVGNTIEANGMGLGIDRVTGLFLKDNSFIKQSPKVLRGGLFKDNPELLFRHDPKKYGVSVNASCPALPETLYVQGCRFRKNGALGGDGMDDLAGRVKVSACAKSTTDVKKTATHEEEENEE